MTGIINKTKECSGGEHLRDVMHKLEIDMNFCILGMYYTHSILNVFISVLDNCAESSGGLRRMVDSEFKTCC